MGLKKWLFGGGVKQVGNIVEQVGGVFRPNAEKSEVREADYNQAVMAQYATEFQVKEPSKFQSFVMGLNSLVRPIVTPSLLAPIPLVMIYPERTTIAFAALALLPAGYWALVSMVLGFYYGGRMQIKSHDFHKSIADAVERAPQVIENIKRLRNELTPGEAEDDDPDVALEIAGELPVTGNSAIRDWQKLSRGRKS